MLPLNEQKPDFTLLPIGSGFTPFAVRLCDCWIGASRQWAPSARHIFATARLGGICLWPLADAKPTRQLSAVVPCPCLGSAIAHWLSYLCPTRTCSARGLFSQEGPKKGSALWQSRSFWRRCAGNNPDCRLEVLLRRHAGSRRTNGRVDFTDFPNFFGQRTKVLRGAGMQPRLAWKTGGAPANCRGCECANQASSTGSHALGSPAVDRGASLRPVQTT